LRSSPCRGVATHSTRLWPTFCTIALEYIALVFAADFILGPLQAGGSASIR
jgi:hypothetical protein